MGERWWNVVQIYSCSSSATYADIVSMFIAQIDLIYFIIWFIYIRFLYYVWDIRVLSEDEIIIWE